jgi:hypothetical protein
MDSQSSLPAVMVRANRAFWTQLFTHWPERIRCAKKPIREGETRAHSIIELDGFTITKTFTPSGGGTLKVVPTGSSAGVAQPQTVLNDLIGSLGALTFDPLEFSRMSSEKQSTCLRELVGLKFEAMDLEKQDYYDKRREINRDIATRSARLAGRSIQEAPKLEIQVTDILDKKRKVEEANRRNQISRDHLRKLTADKASATSNVEFYDTQIKNLEAQLADAKSRRNAAGASILEAKLELEAHEFLCEKLVDQDLCPFDDEILRVQEVNANVRANRELLRDREDLKALELQSKQLTDKIDAIEKSKSTALAAAKFPLKGLSFSSTGGVVYNGIPFQQISTAEHLRVSAAISMALNPKLKVMLIRDGSLMDSESLSVLKELSEKNKYQLWIERVGGVSGDMPTVVIEDGEISESTVV